MDVLDGRERYERRKVAKSPAGLALRAIQKYDQLATFEAVGQRRLLIEAMDALGDELGLECTGDADGDGLYDHSNGTCPVHEWLVPSDHDAAEALRH